MEVGSGREAVEMEGEKRKTTKNIGKTQEEKGRGEGERMIAPDRKRERERQLLKNPTMLTLVNFASWAQGGLLHDSLHFSVFLQFILEEKKKELGKMSPK